MYHLVDWIYILLDGLVCSIGGYFYESRCTSVADWSEVKTCQTSLLGKSICSSFCRRFQTFVRKTEMEWQITEALIMVIGYVKRTARRKTEQSKLRWKDENSSLNSRSFKELLVNIRLETSSSPGYTNKRRTSYVYHVQFPHIFQFLGGDCVFFSFTDFHHHHLYHRNFRSVFIFSVVSLA